jgi:hypothetical protein
VLHATPSANADLASMAAMYDSGFVSPVADRIVVGRLTRAGREIVLVVNVGRAGYNGVMTARNAAQWVGGDPATGGMGPVETDEQGRIVLLLPARAARILIEPSRSTDGAPSTSQEPRTRMAEFKVSG